MLHASGCRNSSGIWFQTRVIWFLACVLALLLAPTPARAQAPTEPIRVPLTIHVASEDGHAVVSESHILASVRRANRELAGFGIHLWIREIVPMEGGAQIESSDDRYGLARTIDRDGSVHVFFVDRVALTNPRKGDRRVSGMHWRYHGVAPDIRSREYLAVAHNAPTTTLVHEVGHAFGLTHDSDNHNLMCSCQRSLQPAFTERQGRQLRNGARRYLLRHRARRQRA